MQDNVHAFRKISLKETRFVTIIAFLAWTIAVYDYILFGTLLPRIEESFGWDSSHALLVSTLVSAGVFLVIIFFGPLIDKLGRRKGMMASVGGSAVAGGASALAKVPSAWWHPCTVRCGPCRTIGQRHVSQ